MTDEQRTKRKTSGLVWAWVPVVVFVVQGAVLAITMTLASGTGLEAVEPDYYAQSLDWDQRAELVRNAERLGWDLDIAVGQPEGPSEHRAITATLRDTTDEPIDDASIELEMFPHAAAGERDRISLSTFNSGYMAEAAFHRTGLWEFRATITRGDDKALITTTVEIDE